MRAFQEEERRHGDDLSLGPILDTLTPSEVETWCLEVDLEEELTPEFGSHPGFYDIVEREIYARGIETA